MTRFAESYAVWLADYYLLATVLLALSLAGMAFLKQPAQRLMVTKSTLLALVLLAILCTLPGWSVVHLLAADRPAVLAQPPREEPMAVSEAVARPDPTQSNPVRRPASPTLDTPTADEDLAKSNTPKMSWPTLLAIAHAIGMGCIVIWLTLGWIASVRLRRTVHVAPPNVSAIMDELASLNSRTSKPLQLFTHDRIDVAVALGVRRPMILLPNRWTSNQSHDRLQAVLAHEATHVLNCDLQWVALARTLFVALWANPLFWLTKRRLRLDQEALADAAAAEVTSRQQYAEQLVAWARDARSRPALHLSSTVGLWEGPSQLRQRIAILLNDRLTIMRNCSWRWRVASVAVCGLVAVALSLVTIQPGRTARAADSDGEQGALANAPKPETPNAKSRSLMKDRPKIEKEGDNQSVTWPSAKQMAEVAQWQAKTWQIELHLDMPSLDTRAVQYAIFDKDPLPGYTTQVKLMHKLHRPQYEKADTKQWKDIMRAAEIRTDWDNGFKDVTAENLALLTEQQGRVLSSNDAGGKKWIVTKTADIHGQPICWSIPAEVKIGKRSYITLNSSNKFDLQTAYDNALADAHDDEKPEPRKTSPPATEPQSQKALFDLYRKHFKLPEPNVVGGFVVDEKLQPIAQAKVSLYRTNWRDITQELIAEKSTDANGKVRFDEVFNLAKEFPGGKIPPDNGVGPELLQVIVRAPGRVTYSRLDTRQLVARRGEPLMIVMLPAATLHGRVTGPDGKPVAGALVSVGTGSLAPWAEAMSARTNAAGDYEINDLAPFDLKQREEQEAAIRSGKGAAMDAFRASPPFLTLTVEHPDFAVGQAQVEKTPGTTNLHLEPAAVLVGRVVFGDSGKSAGGARVSVAGHHQKLSEIKQDDAGGSDEQRRFAMPFYTASARADAEGKYRFASLPPGYYHLLAEMPGWVNVGLRDVPADAGKTNDVLDLTLTKGGTVSIRLVDAKTREPIQVPPEAQALIGNHEQPIYDRVPTQRTVPASKNGLFELSLPAGKQELYVAAVYVGEDRKWMGGAATPAESSNVVVTVTESKMVQADLPVIDPKNAKVTGTFVPGPPPKQQPKAPPSTEKKQDKTPSDTSKQGSGVAPPRRESNTASGRVVDEKGQPIAGAEVFLFHLNQHEGTRKLLGRQSADADGQFRFASVIDIDREFPGRKFPSDTEIGDEMLQGIVRAPGHISHFWWIVKQSVAQRGDYQQIKMLPSASLRGTVTDPNGKPVAGALVSIGNGEIQYWEGALASRTDAEGNYKIDDIGPYDATETEKQFAEQKRQQEAQGNRTPLYSYSISHPVLTVQHPNFATKQTGFEKSPGTKNIQLAPAAILEGRVVFANSGKPATGVFVGAGTSLADRGPPTPELLREIVKTSVHTDADGKYRVATLAAGKYDLWADTPGWVNLGVNDVVATAGKTASVPDLKFTKGGSVNARLIDAKTGAPIAVQPAPRAYFLIRPVSQRPSVRPQPAPYVTADSEGRFKLDLLPGKIMLGAGGASIDGKLKFSGRPTTEVTVVEGETVDVDLPVSELPGESPVHRAANLRANGKPLEAIKLLNEVLDKDPNNLDALSFRADAWQSAGDDRKSIADYERFLKLNPPVVPKMVAWNNLAFILATSPDDSVRDGKRAVDMAETAKQLQETPTPDVLDTLAAAYAETGQFDRAVTAEQEAIKIAPENQRDEFRKYLKLYEDHKPRREKR